MLVLVSLISVLRETYGSFAGINIWPIQAERGAVALVGGLIKLSFCDRGRGRSYTGATSCQRAALLDFDVVRGRLGFDFAQLAIFVRRIGRNRECRGALFSRRLKSDADVVVVALLSILAELGLGSAAEVALMPSPPASSEPVLLTFT